jgi:hypothetical protein
MGRLFLAGGRGFGWRGVVFLRGDGVKGADEEVGSRQFGLEVVGAWTEVDG